MPYFIQGGKKGWIPTWNPGRSIFSTLFEWKFHSWNFSDTSESCTPFKFYVVWIRWRLILTTRGEKNASAWNWTRAARLGTMYSVIKWQTLDNMIITLENQFCGFIREIVGNHSLLRQPMYHWHWIYPLGSIPYSVNRWFLSKYQNQSLFLMETCLILYLFCEEKLIPKVGTNMFIIITLNYKTLHILWERLLDFNKEFENSSTYIP